MKRLPFFFELTGLTLFAFAQMAPAASTNRYVALNSASATAPYTNWSIAASNIQDAIDASFNSDVIWVSNGVYEVGGRTNYPTGKTLTNRVAIWKAITVRSANNDPANTIIKGAWDPVTTNGPAAVRCVYMANNSSLIGFTVTNGATLTNGSTGSQAGGGIYAQDAGADATISNCVIAGNAADQGGGGVVYGTCYNCTIAGNVSLAYAGGGTSATILRNCRLIGNTAYGYGGGAYGGTMYDCLVAGNSARDGPALTGRAGGAYDVTLSNCTIVGNRIYQSNTNFGGGAYSCRLTNCIVYFNRSGSAGTGTSDASGGAVYTCASALMSGNGNISADPRFITDPTGSGTNYVAGDYRLQNNSPTINTGTNQSWMTNAYDLDGRTRIRYGTVDMGACEAIYNGSVYMIP